ncbi:hypothetical protein BHE74_00003901 [Ensete ventricosum]|nr:hypothetical protein BHE74_00003901 [Ensete ventricosum]RZR92374.1 hypothetical protein BHM03_00020657 [Ensete ventricosum]
MNLYPKGKGKVHPSPAAPLSAGGDEGGPSVHRHDALAVLRLLPAAILALTAALTCEDKEVLAYLITQSIHGPAAGMEPRRRRETMPPAHRPLFDCGCFDCYASFWSRWDCSPDRELIHQAIEAFEERLASSENKGGSDGCKGRRRERKARDRTEKGKGKGKQKKERGKSVEVEELVVQEAKLFEASVASGAARFSGEVKEASETAEPATEVKGEERSGEEDAVAVAVAVASERRRGWPDLMGLFNPRFWSLWCPGA